MEAPAVLKELIDIWISRGVGRIRFAVSPEEYNEIRKYCLSIDGRFHGRVRDIPLIVEDREPELWTEYR